MCLLYLWLIMVRSKEKKREEEEVELTMVPLSPFAGHGFWKGKQEGKMVRVRGEDCYEEKREKSVILNE